MCVCVCVCVSAELPKVYRACYYLFGLKTSAPTKPPLLIWNCRVTLLVFVCFTALVDLNGRFFGGRTVTACFYNIDKFRRLDLAS